MKEIFRERSTNGRWGLAVVGPDEIEALPCEGGVEYLGKVAGIDTYLLKPGKTGTWVAVFGDVTIHGGATSVAEMGLQSGNAVSLLLLGPQAVVEHHGYKRRGSTVVAYAEGVPTEIPATVMLAMGVIKSDNASPAVVIEPPPPLQGAMAAAFASLKGPAATS